MSEVQKPNLWRVMKSVAASVFGVQSQHNYKNDFENSNSIVPYAIVGVVFVALLIFAIIAVVNLALS